MDTSTPAKCFYPWTAQEQRLIAIIPKIASLFSIIGSAYIVCVVIRGRKFNSAYNRIMLGMSIGDIIASFGHFLPTWPIPSHAPDSEHPANVVVGQLENCYYGNIGNVATCELQGFLIQTGSMVVPIFNAILSMYFLLTVRYNWRERKFRQIGPFVLIIVLYPLVTSIICLKWGLFNPLLDRCWIASYPLACLEDDKVECIRGKRAESLKKIFFILPVAASFVAISLSMALLCVHVFRIESRVQSYQVSSRFRERSKKVFVRACLYVSSYLFVWAPAVLYQLFLRSRKGLITTIFVSSALSIQGIFNALIFAKCDCFSCFRRVLKSCKRRLSCTFSDDVREELSDESV